MKLNEINFKNITEKAAVYQIKNVMNDKVFIAGGKNFKRHLKSLYQSLEKNLDRNPEELRHEYSIYGPEFFEVKILKRLYNYDFNRLLEIKDHFIRNTNRLYNVKLDSIGGGYEIISEPCYLITLNGKIYKEFPSIQSAYKSLNLKPHYAGKNTPAVVGGKYRVVTKDFYKNNLDEIESWPHYTDLNKYIAKVYRKSVMVSAVINGEKQVFKNVTELSKVIDRTKESIRVTLRGKTKSNPYQIKYVNQSARAELKYLKKLKERKNNLKKMEKYVE